MLHEPFCKVFNKEMNFIGFIRGCFVIDLVWFDFIVIGTFPNVEVIWKKMI